MRFREIHLQKEVSLADREHRCIKKGGVEIGELKLPGGGLGDGAMVRTAAAGRYLAGMSVFWDVGTTGGSTFTPMGFCGVGVGHSDISSLSSIRSGLPQFRYVSF